MKAKFFVTLIILSCFRPDLTAGTSGSLKVYSINKNTEICPGGSGTIKIKIEIPDNLYIYGNPKGPGIGRPTTIDIIHPDNFIFDDAKFAVPKKYTAKGDTNHVWIYRNETKIELPFKTNRNSKPGEYGISILLKALLCSDKSCIPYEYTIDHPVRITSNPSDAVKNNNKFKDTVFSSPGKGHGDNSFENENRKDINTYSDETSLFEPRFLSKISISNIIQAVFYGIIAGFILNFMPCVLPVISLKILDIIKYSRDNRKEIRKTGLVFTMGIMTTFIVLASLAAFLGYSWGGLFQSSAYLIIMIAVVFILSLSLFEVFTINIPGFSGRSSRETAGKYVQAYSKGLMATLLATPCSGPFLGGTLAWTFIQPPVVIFIIFISIGIGMSAPYILLTSNPGLMKFIPKPGDWMTVFENIMGFLLFGTTIYFIGILESGLIMPTLCFLLFIAIAFWQYGRLGAINKPRRDRVLSRIALVLMITSGYFVSYDYLYRTEEPAEVKKNAFSQSLLYANRDAGKISIVDFTADWCPNCKLVERTSLFTTSVIETIRENNIGFLTADMTRENPEAKSLLTGLGSRSIPFLAVFPAGRDFFKPICLRDIYSKKDVLKAIDMAK